MKDANNANVETTFVPAIPEQKKDLTKMTDRQLLEKIVEVLGVR